MISPIKYPECKRLKRYLIRESTIIHPKILLRFLYLFLYSIYLFSALSSFSFSGL